MPAQPKRVLVVGASGYAGRYLVQRLHDAGYRIRAVVRNRPRALAPGPYNAPALRGLVDDWVVAADQLQLDATIMDGVDHVVSALGVTRQKSDPWMIDFRLNLHYLKLAELHRVSSFLYVGVMHAGTGTSILSRAKHAVMEVLQRSTIPAHIVNPSGYFSDLTAVYDLARRGIAVGLGDGSTRLSPMHGADLADFCVMQLPGPAGSWDVGGPEVLTYRQVVDLAFQTLGKQERYLSIPKPVARTAVWCSERLSQRAGTLTRFMVEGLQCDSAAPIAHGTHTLGDYYASLPR